jgi:hypothetical protein
MSASTLVLAQSQAVAPQAAAAANAPGGVITREEVKLDSSTQKIEHIQVDGQRVQVNELRAGGQTESITVKPKGRLPQYDVQPMDMSRPQVPPGVPGGAGQRTWKLVDF